MRPCSLCAFFVLTGADSVSGAYARCDCRGYEREISAGTDVLRCANFQYARPDSWEAIEARRKAVRGLSSC